ncbi:hypothetical protein ACJJTC_008756 [Scirpophaga incertulas]
MCSPCGPMVCYKYEDCGPPKGQHSDDATKAADASAQQKEKELKRTKSRELRAGIMYYSCHCIKRNGLQHDCRRTGCGGEPSCLVLPDPVCGPSQLARARGLADPAVLKGALHSQHGETPTGAVKSSSGSSGKRFIVCELKGMLPTKTNADKSDKCSCPVDGGPGGSKSADMERRICLY